MTSPKTNSNFSASKNDNKGQIDVIQEEEFEEIDKVILEILN